MKKTIFVILALFMVVSACKKYPNGPFLTFRTPQERLIGTWHVTRYIVDTTDETQYQSGTRWQFMKQSDSIIIEGDSRALNQYVVQPGHWGFTQNNALLNLTIPQFFGDNETHVFTIKELKFKKMTIVSSELGVTYSFTLARF